MIRAACLSLALALVFAAPAALAASGAPPKQAVTARSAAEVADLLSRRTPPPVIALAPGSYGVLTLGKLTPPHPVVITTAGAGSKGPRAVFSGIAMAAVSDITFDGVDVHQPSTAETTINSMAIRVSGGTRLTFRNMTVSGEPAVTGVPPETPAGGLDKTGNVIGMPTGKGIFVTESTDVVLERLDVSAFRHGIVLNSSTGLQVLDSEIHDLRTSPLVGGNLNDVLVRGNHFHSSRPWAFSGKGDHADHVHFYSRPDVQSRPSDRIVITENHFEQGDGQSILGIYLDDNNAGIGFTNVEITDNLIHNGHQLGIVLEHVVGATVRNNTLLQSSGDETDAPGITLTQSSRDIRIEKNIIGHLSYLKDQTQDGIHAAGNVMVQRHRPDGEHYYGDLFVDAMKPGATPHELSALPGGVLETLGVGAPVTRFDTTPETLTPVARVAPAEAAAPLAFAFDAGHSADAEGFLDDKDASFEWDLGDGTRKAGRVVEHAYEEPGTYTVGLTVRHADGTVAETRTEVTAAGAELLLLDFEKGAADASFQAHQAAWKGPEAYTSGTDGKAAAFSAGTPASIEIPARPELGGMDELTIAFDLLLTGANTPKGQRPLWMQGSYGAEITKTGDLIFLLWLRDGSTVRLPASVRGRGLRDGKWHRVSLAYSGKKGLAVATLDGREIARKAGIGGDIGPTKAAPLAIGSGPFRDPLSGAIDNVRITRTFDVPGR